MRDIVVRWYDDYFHFAFVISHIIVDVTNDFVEKLIVIQELVLLCFRIEVFEITVLNILMTLAYEGSRNNQCMWFISLNNSHQVFQSCV